ncbi:MAG: YfgM family protein [Succinivibrionaceae bacterium]
MLYSTEQQQAEVLQEFWKKNGKTLLLGVLIGVIGIFAWQGFKKYQQQGREAVTSQYMFALEKINADYNDSTVKAVEDLIAAQKGTIYADMAALNLAALTVERKSDYASAARLLAIAAESKDSAVSGVAVLRLARVLAAQEKYDDAIRKLDGVSSTIYRPAALEIKGDILLSQGKKKEAFAAYQSAFDLVKGTPEENANPALKIKLNDLNGN